ncbi:MAG: transporter [Moraxellaceae bacterium]|jgi:MFS family permease|nr:transporter [Moraxellaceae bacterium]
MSTTPPPATAPFTLLFLAIMSMVLGQTLVFTLLPLLGREVGLKELQVGVIITASSAVYALAARYWGRQSDVWGRRRVMLVGLSGYTAGTLLFAGLFWLGMLDWLQGLMLWSCLIVARCAQSLVMAGTMPAANAYICDITTPATRTAGLARLGAANSMGTIIGPACGGLLAAISLLAPLLFAAAITGVCLVLMVWRLPESPRHGANGGEAPRIHLGYNDGRYRVVLLIAVAMLVAYSVVQQTLAFYFQDVLRLDSQQAARQVGLALMLSAAVALVAQALLVQRMNWAPARLTFWGMASLVAGSAALGVAGSTGGLFFGVGLCGLGIGLAFPACLALASLAVGAEEQGALAGLTSSVPALGSIIGPVLGTGLYQLHPHLPYLANAVLLLPMLWLSWRFHRRQPVAAP